MVSLNVFVVFLTFSPNISHFYLVHSLLILSFRLITYFMIFVFTQLVPIFWKPINWLIKIDIKKYNKPDAFH